MFIPDNLAFYAFLLGFISAVSLLIGSLVGITLKPKAVINSAFMAFGAGALLFALTIEIIAYSFEKAGFWPLAVGCVTGGLIYELLNHKLNQLGAFFRKGATIIRHLTNLKVKRAGEMIERLSKTELFSSLPPADFALIAPQIEEVGYKKGTILYKKGAWPDACYIIRSGRVAVQRNEITVAELGAGDIFGEMSLLTDSARNASIRIEEKTELFRISKKTFAELMSISPLAGRIIKDLVDKRSDELVQKALLAAGVSEEWKRKATDRLKELDFRPSVLDIKKESEAHGSAAFGIWLGILLDGIPESLVIGILLTGTKAAPWALIAGVFLANFPEAMSSSAVMRTQNYKRFRILCMWGSIVLMTAIGSMVGNLFLQGLLPGTLALIEGLAAGAMLTMIAETMLPEAYEQGGAVVGLSTLAGFLSALFIKYIG